MSIRSSKGSIRDCEGLEFWPFLKVNKKTDFCCRSHFIVLTCRHHSLELVYIVTDSCSLFCPDGAVDASIFPTSGRIFFLSGDITRTITISILPLDYLQGFKVCICWSSFLGAGIAEWLASRTSECSWPGFQCRWGQRNLVMELVNIYHALSWSFVEIMCLFVVSVCINLSYGIVGMTWHSFVLSYLLVAAYCVVHAKPCNLVPCNVSLCEGLRAGAGSLSLLPFRIGVENNITITYHSNWHKLLFLVPVISHLKLWYTSWHYNIVHVNCCVCQQL